MMRKVFLTVFILLLAITSHTQGARTREVTQAEIEKFLGDKEIICKIDFAVNSSELSTEAQKALSGVAARIKAVDLDKKMIRIEGFSSPDGNKLLNFRLSIDRARAVERFLRTKHGVSLEHYISGFGPTVQEGVPAAGTRSVQIVIYNNPWGQDEVPVVSAGGN